MSRPVDQHSLISDQSHESAGNDECAAAAMQKLEEHPEEKRAEIIIQASDLTMVMRECCLQRQEAIDLIQKANGDIKAALKLYVHQS